MALSEGRSGRSHHYGFFLCANGAVLCKQFGPHAAYQWPVRFCLQPILVRHTRDLPANDCGT